MNRFAVAASFAAMLSGCTCSKRGGPSVNVDASTAGLADGGDAARTDVPLVVVAEGPSDVSAVRTADNRIVVANGPELYEATPDGSLVPLIQPAELATLIPDDETVVGYATTHAVYHVAGSVGGTLVLEAMTGSGLASIYTVRNGKVAQLGTGLQHPHWYRDHVLAWSFDKEAWAWADGAVLPTPRIPADADLDWSRIYDGPSGTLIGHPTRVGSVAVWTSASDMPKFVSLPDGDGDCRPITSFDGRAVMLCGSHLYALVDPDGAAKAVRIFDRKDVDVTRAGSIGADGSMYIGGDSKVVRCVPDGACTTRPIPKTPMTRGATYDYTMSEFVKHEGGPSWLSLRVEAIDTQAGYGDVEQVLARGPNDVWVFLRQGPRMQILHSSAPPAKPKILPGPADARVALRNLRPVGAWTHSCDQVFVLLGTDADGIVKREKDIYAALGVEEESWDEPFTWAVVEGTLGDRRGVGVVLARSTPEKKIAALEKAVNRLIDKLSTGGANRPSAYCTLPVLERRLLPPVP